MKPSPKMQQVIKQLAERHGVSLTEGSVVLRLDQPGFDRLVIKAAGPHLISVAHTFEANGQLIPDPEVVFFTGYQDIWIPTDIAQSIGGWRTYVELSEDGTQIQRVNPAGQADLAEFTEVWAQNLIDQNWLDRGVRYTEPALPGATPLFSLGMTVATPGALAALEQAGQLPQEFLVRHVSGDWGSLEEDDRLENERALKQGTRLLSAYQTHLGTKLWVITEWDRSVTTILTPQEY